MKKDKMEKGFTLLELLVTILIISIVMVIAGVFTIRIIQNSEEQSVSLANNSIKESASTYVKEFPNNVIWQEQEGTPNTYACISVNELINKGYFTKEEITNIKDLKEYVVLTRNKNKIIIKEELDQSGICNQITGETKIPIPTAKEYCQENLVYNGEEQSLIKEGLAEKFSFSNDTQTNAGSYKVGVTIKDGFVWEDDTRESKFITCTIKKRVPKFLLNPNGESGTELGNSDIKLEMDNVDKNVGGKISLKTSNKETATASLKTDLQNGIAELSVQKLATRKANTYITITFTPDDKMNYYSSSQVYTIGNIDKQKIPIPTTEQVCKNPDYNGKLQIITNDTLSNSGYEYYHNEYQEIGSYEVIAKIKYGYIWSDNTLEDKEYTCSIERPTPTVTFVGNKFNTSKVVSNGLTLSYTPDNSYLTLNGTFAQSGLTLMYLPSQSFKVGEKYKITLKHISGSYSQTYGKGGVLATDILNSSYQNVSTRNYVDTGFPLNNTQTSTLTVTSAGANEGSVLRVWLYENQANDYVFNQYKIQITITKVDEQQKTYGSTYGTLGQTPTRYGANFVGWYDGYTGGNRIESTTIVNNFNDHEIYAHTTNNKYTMDVNPDYNTYGANYGAGARVKSFDLRIVDVNGNELYTANDIQDFCDSTTKYGAFGSIYYITDVKYKDGYKYSSYTLTNSNTATTSNLGIISVASDGTSFTFSHSHAGTIWFSINTEPIQYTLDINPDSNSYGANYEAGARIKSFNIKVVGEDGGTVVEKTTISDFCQNIPFNSTVYITNVAYKDGYHYKDYKFSSSSVSVTTANATTYTFKQNKTSNISLSINTTPNVCSITFAPNGGTFNNNASNTVQKLNYGDATTGNDGIWNANGGTYSAARTGYHIDGATAWIRTSDNVTFDETKNYKATDFCPKLAIGDQSVTLNANWKINVCTINFDANGGSFASGTSKVKTINYGGDWTNLWNALGDSSHFKATAPSGYTKIKAAVAWMNNSTKVKYSHASDVTYKVTDFCPSIASGNQTVTLSANWYRRQKRTYNSCKTGSNTCKYGCDTCTYSCDENLGVIGGTLCTKKGGYFDNLGRCIVPSTCKGDCNCSNCYTGKNTCQGGWNSWNTVSSCSTSSTVQCRDNFKLTQ